MAAFNAKPKNKSPLNKAAYFLDMFILIKFVLHHSADALHRKWWIYFQFFFVLALSSLSMCDWLITYSNDRVQSLNKSAYFDTISNVHHKNAIYFSVWKRKQKKKKTIVKMQFHTFLLQCIASLRRPRPGECCGVLFTCIWHWLQNFLFHQLASISLALSIKLRWYDALHTHMLSNSKYDRLGEY